MFYELFQNDYEIKDLKDSIQVILDLPGFKKEDIKVEGKDSMLTIRAKNERKNYSKSFRINNSLDLDNIKAKLEFGQLTLNIPYSKTHQHRLIEVE